MAEAGPTPAGLAVVLPAAGFSRRLGQNKLLVRIRGEPLVRRSARLACGYGRVHVVVPPGDTCIRHALRGLPVQCHDNPGRGTGMASSIAVGVRASAATDAIMILLADQYALTASGLGQLVAHWRHDVDRIVAARYSGRRGPPVIFPRRFRAHLCALHGEQGARDLLLSADVCDLPMPEAGGDLDTSADLRVMRAFHPAGIR